VGWGIVPENKVARVFRDIMGKVHQIISKNSDYVYLMVSGMPLILKGGVK
jgi:adenosylcobinamide kinase/adenosylcobinamide-phosphate guanylyltransferase